MRRISADNVKNMKTKTSSGFTLIELLVTLAVAAVALTIGVPGFQDWIRNNQITAQTNTLVTALNLARSEAIKRGGNNVILCKRDTDGTACNNAGNWEDGWLLFEDGDGDGAFSGDGDATLCEANEDCLIRSFEPLAGVTIRTGGNFQCWVGFQSNGLPVGSGSGCAGNGLGNDTFRVCRVSATDTSKSRSVVVWAPRRIRIQDSADECP
jgi:type IV fimbrial biogenesis protein FimT